MGHALILAIVMPWAAHLADAGSDPRPYLDICHPLWLSRTPDARACGLHLRHMQTLELRTLRHYCRPGGKAKDLTSLSLLAADVDALSPALSAYTQTARLAAQTQRCIGAWRRKGRTRQADLALLCDAAIELQEQIVAHAGPHAARQDHLAQVLSLRGRLSDLRTRRTWNGLGARERDEVLNAFGLWPRLAEQALDRADALVARLRPRPGSRQHVLCALLLAYVRQHVAVSGRSMLRRGDEILPRTRWALWREGTREERRAAAAAATQIDQIARRSAASAHVPLRVLVATQQHGLAAAQVPGPACDVLQDRRLRAGVQAVFDALAQGDF